MSVDETPFFIEEGNRRGGPCTNPTTGIPRWHLPQAYKTRHGQIVGICIYCAQVVPMKVTEKTNVTPLWRQQPTEPTIGRKLDALIREIRQFCLAPQRKVK